MRHFLRASFHPFTAITIRRCLRTTAARPAFPRTVSSLKALKQALNVKTFLGTSANAVKTQIWTALIAMLILKYLQMKLTFGWSLSNLAALLRQQLFTFRDLWAWLNNPLDGPPAARQLGEQLPMPLVWQRSVGQQKQDSREAIWITRQLEVNDLDSMMRQS
jgi:hypothetical protein